MESSLDGRIEEEEEVLQSMEIETFKDQVASDQKLLKEEWMVKMMIIDGQFLQSRLTWSQILKKL